MSGLGWELTVGLSSQLPSPSVSFSFLNPKGSCFSFVAQVFVVFLNEFVQTDVSQALKQV